MAWFELRYWLRSWMPWIFLLLIAAAVGGALGSDEVLGEFGLSNIARNAPFAVAAYYSTLGVFTLLMTAIFVNSAALRDITCNTTQLIYATPLRRRDLLLGRFAGATAVATFPMLGVSVALLLARYIPGLGAGPWAAVSWTAHVKGLLLFAIPNAFLTAAILFAAAVVWRKEIAPFVAALLLFLARAVSGQLFRDVRWEQVRSLLDPFGARAFATATKYWTVADKNVLVPGFSGILLWNRLLWIATGCAAFAVAYARFRFSEGAIQRKADDDAEEPEDIPHAGPMPSPISSPGLTDAAWPKFAGSLRLHFREVARNRAFAVLVLIAATIAVLALVFGAAEFEGNETYATFPVTYVVIEILRMTLDFVLVVIIIYFAGVLVWKDRDERMDAILDATPTPEWLSYASRLAALMAMVMLIQTVALGAGIVFQATHGYHHFELALYVRELILRDASGFVFVAVLAFFCHVLAPNKYAGYVAFITVYLLNIYLWPALNVATHLVQLMGRPRVIESEFFGDAPYRTAWNWFTLYWLLFFVLLALATVLFWPRGRYDRWRARRREAALRFTAPWKIAAAACAVAFTACGGWIAWNTEVLNRVDGPQDRQSLQAEYEKTYKPFARLHQPHVRSVTYAIDLDPARRNVTIHGSEVIVNTYPQPLDAIHFTLDARYDTAIDLPDAVLTKDDPRLSYRIYRFRIPMQPGEARTLRFTVTSRNRGFENDVSNPQLAQNGTFLSNLGTLVTGANYMAPIIGYDFWRALTDATARKRYGLTEVDLMPPPQRNCTEDCRDTYIPGHSDWVDIRAVISTTPDQIAVAPGSLVREWRQNGRRYFEYKLDHPSTNLYCFASARYAVARDQWHGVALEVYYLKEQPWNVPRMMTSMKQSLDYYTRNFGPYAHKQLRILEFPRVAGYAAALPGTMPISESFGFIADLNHRDDIDTVYYVVAHETAHQWWDEQVIGADMEGATLLSESLAQYSALMVMEKTYGRDLMRKFLRYEMDLYLRARGQERLRERPLAAVEYRQFYVFYQKGAVALYYLKEMIGEDAVNRALHKLIQRYAYAPAPYPTSYALLDALREETPPHLQYLIKDLFEDITLFSNRTLAATAVKRADGQYDVTLDVEARKFKDDATGRETEVPVDDWIDLGGFAKPAPGGKYGATLFRQRVHITARRASFTFTVSQLPEKAGIDPFALLIDRIPDDNVRDVTVR
jgi:ABC-2 type transport system permease protein